MNLHYLKKFQKLHKFHQYFETEHFEFFLPKFQIDFCMFVFNIKV